MMVAGSFPYPVLGNADDVTSEFALSDVSYMPGVEDITLRFRVRIDDPQVRALIDAGQLRVEFPWSCPSTLQTGDLDPIATRVNVDGWTMVAYLDQASVRGKVHIRSLVTVAEPIADFKLDRQNEQYGDATFDLAPGDVIGLGSTFEIVVGKLYDPYNPPLSSIFKFVSDASQARGFKVSFAQDEQVVVSVAESLHASIREMSHQPHVLLMSLVFPVLMETLHFLRMNEHEGAEDLGEKDWVRSLNRMFDKKNLHSWKGSDDRISELAQILLEQPLDKGFSALAQMMEDDNGDAFEDSY